MTTLFSIDPKDVNELLSAVHARQAVIIKQAADCANIRDQQGEKYWRSKLELSQSLYRRLTEAYFRLEKDRIAAEAEQV